MEKPSGKFIIVIITILIWLVIGCSSRQEPITTEIPTETPNPSPSNTPVVTAPIPKSTETKTVGEQPLSISDLESSPLLVPNNVSQLTILGEQTLDPENDVSFSLFDWSNDGSRIVVCAFSDSESSYRVYDLLENTILAEIPVSEWLCVDYVRDAGWLQFSRDSNLFSGLTIKDHPDGNSYNTPAIYRSQSGEIVSVLAAQPSNVKYPPEVVFSSQGTRLALSDNIASSPVEDPNADFQAGFYMIRSVEIDLFDVQTGGHWGTFLRYTDKVVRDLEYSTAGQYLVVGTNQAAEAWDVTGGLTYRLECPNSLITFSPAAEIAAVSCVPFEGDSYQMLWDLESGDVLSITDAPGNYSQELKFSLDGRLVVGLSDDGMISFWNGETGDYLATLPESYLAPVDVNFTGEGRLVAVLLEDGRLKLYGVD